MADLVNNQIRVRDLLPNHKRPAAREVARREVRLQRGQETVAVAGLVRRVGFGFVGREEGGYEEGAPWGLTQGLALRRHVLCFASCGSVLL